MNLPAWLDQIESQGHPAPQQLVRSRQTVNELTADSHVFHSSSSFQSSLLTSGVSYAR